MSSYTMSDYNIVLDCNTVLHCITVLHYNTVLHYYTMLHYNNTIFGVAVLTGDPDYTVLH